MMNITEIRSRFKLERQLPYIKRTDLLWLSGLYEGEGWFTTKGANNIEVGIKMTDEDVIRRVSDLLDKPYTTKVATDPKWKHQYGVILYGQKAIEFCILLSGLMGLRRQAALEKCCDHYKPINAVGPYKRISDTQIKEVFEQLAQGLPERDVAQNLNLSRSSVNDIKHLRYVRYRKLYESI